ncbi:MAG: DDE-type integrase/transposase/recombinase [Nitrososphaerales archaeon]
MIRVEERDSWFWEMLDEDTKFLVATHISGSRTFEDTVAIFQKGYDMAKNRPQAVFVDGSHVYQSAFNKVFYSRYKVNQVDLIQRVGIKARETNNCIERQHQTLKARTKVMRGLKSMDSTKDVLTGYAVHYNFVRPHQSLENKTPAQVAGLKAASNWKGLIEQATQSKEISAEAKGIEAIAV